MCYDDGETFTQTPEEVIRDVQRQAAEDVQKKHYNIILDAVYKMLYPYPPPAADVLTLEQTLHSIVEQVTGYKFTDIVNFAVNRQQRVLHVAYYEAEEEEYKRRGWLPEI